LQGAYTLAYFSKTAMPEKGHNINTSCCR
jgi:hypothetical protein